MTLKILIALAALGLWTNIVIAVVKPVHAQEATCSALNDIALELNKIGYQLASGVNVK